MNFIKQIELLEKQINNKIKNYFDILYSANEIKKTAIEWYEKHPSNNERLIKLINNIIYYCSNEGDMFSFKGEILSAICKTLLITAEYDILISPFPHKVKERNDNHIKLCKSLKNEKKIPVEENSDKPYDMTIFLASYNQLELTKLCIESIIKNTSDVSYELFLIDNGSSDGTYEYFKNHPKVKVIRLIENVGLLLALHIFYESYIDNGKFWMYMNNDVIVTSNWASNMLNCIKSNPKIASVMPITNRAAPFTCINTPFGLYDAEKVDSFGDVYNTNHKNIWQEWNIYYGFVLLSRPSVRRKLGYYEDGFYYPFYYSDGDIIISQALAGYQSFQARDAYVHHFDGGHTVMQHRREMLSKGEKCFFEKHGFFPTDIERSLPYTLRSKLDDFENILFLGSSRMHPYLELKSLIEIHNIKNMNFFTADTMEHLKLEPFDESVPFETMKNWYEIDEIFKGKKFDIIIFSDDITKMRNPQKFLQKVFKCLRTNGRFFFTFENTSSLLAMNYIFMTRRNSPRDEVRIRKNSMISINELIQIFIDVGFSLNSIEDIYYNEIFLSANLDTINNYRDLITSPNNIGSFERIIRLSGRNICIRKPHIIDTQNTLESLLYKKRGENA